MSKSTQKAILERVTERYLTSGDFNGYPVRELALDFGLPENRWLETVAALAKRGSISVLTSHEENPYKALSRPAER